MQAPNIHWFADEAERTSSVTEVWRKSIQAGHSCPEHVGALVHDHCPWQAGRWRSTNSSLRTSSSSSSRTKRKGRCLETMARYLLYFCPTVLPSASSGYSIGRLSFTQFVTSVIGIPFSVPFWYIVFPVISWPSPWSSSFGWITSALL